MKKYIFINLLIIILLSIHSVVFAQCPNMNFSMGNLNHWQCYSGTWTDSSITINPCSPIAGRHTIMNRYSGQDEHCSAISKVPTGFNYSLRLGNDSAGAEIDAVEYTLTVDSTNALFTLHFAWVVEDANYAYQNLPTFSMSIKDSNGVRVPTNTLPCGDIDFFAGDEMYYRVCYIKGISNRRETISFSLEPLMGQTIKIYFETRDCPYGDHFGYAYLVTECRPLKIDVWFCEGNTDAHLRAPKDFVWYKWRRSSNPNWVHQGRDYRTILATSPYNDEIFTCELGSVLGALCNVILTTTVKKTSIDAIFQYGIMENGKVDFFKYNYENRYDTCTRTATFVDLSSVHNSKKSSILWEIHGLNVASTDSLFTYTFPEPDTPTTYLVKLWVTAENGCDDTSKLRSEHYITIYPSPRIEIIGETKLCEGAPIGLKAIARKSEFVSYEWTEKTGAILGIGDSITITESGTYYLLAEDIAGCFAKDSIIITYPALKMDAYIKDIDCYGNATGIINHGSFSGGLSPYSPVQWFYIDHNENKSLFKEYGNQMGDILYNLEAGIYIVEAIDRIGCKLIDTIKILQPDSLQIIGTYDAPTNGLDNGKIELTAIGGTPPYRFQIEKSDGTVATNTNSADNLSGGNYVINVTDSKGCVTIDTMMVKPLTANMNISIENVDCYGNATGMFEHGIISGGEEPYSSMQWFYIDLDGNKSFYRQGNQQGALYQNLSAGIYLLEAIDANGDTLVKGVQINQPDSIKIIETQYFNDGKIKIIAIGGTAPYSFQIETLSEITTVTSDSVFYLDKGSYAVIITDANDCIAFDSIVMEENVSIKNTAVSSFSVGQNIPNPAHNTTIIPFSLPENGNIVFELFSINGQLLHKETVSSQKGDNYIEYNTAGLSSGIYFYSVNYKNQRLTKKMVVRK